MTRWIVVDGVHVRAAPEEMRQGHEHKARLVALCISDPCNMDGGAGVEMTPRQARALAAQLRAAAQKVESFRDGASKE